MDDLHSLAQTHYENFPVGSFLLPREIRKPIRLVYAFARVADDIADEGDDTPEARVFQLEAWEGEFQRAMAGGSGDGFFHDLAGMVARNRLPVSHFHELIEAFKMDARGTTYETFEDLKFYCRHSANPIGRILLHLFRSATDEHCRWSDAICTALQLTNFWQDLRVDIMRNRFYIPREDLERFGLTVADLRSPEEKSGVRSLLKFQVERTRAMFAEGRPLLGSIDKRFALELRLTVHGGMKILEKIAAQNYDVSRRPTLSLYDRIHLLGRSLLKR